jgi:hypothetical protein
LSTLDIKPAAGIGTEVPDPTATAGFRAASPVAFQHLPKPCQVVLRAFSKKYNILPEEALKILQNF